jgi:branched-subunit amino acid transport protein
MLLKTVYTSKRSNGTRDGPCVSYIPFWTLSKIWTDVILQQPAKIQPSEDALVLFSSIYTHTLTWLPRSSKCFVHCLVC